MSDLNVWASVTRASLGLDDLQLNEGPYLLSPNITPGEVTFRRETAISPYVDGEYTIAMAKDRPELQIAIDVLPTEDSEIITDIETLIEAFTQTFYDLSISVNGQLWTWNCEAADYSYGFENVRFANRRFAVAFNIPRNPVAEAGVS